MVAITAQSKMFHVHKIEQYLHFCIVLMNSIVNIYAQIHLNFGSTDFNLILRAGHQCVMSLGRFNILNLLICKWLEIEPEMLSPKSELSLKDYNWILAPRIFFLMWSGGTATCSSILRCHKTDSEPIMVWYANYYQMGKKPIT